jgi:hypothetical protein
MGKPVAHCDVDASDLTLTVRQISDGQRQAERAPTRTAVRVGATRDELDQALVALGLETA